MFAIIRFLFGTISRLFCSRRRLLLESLALRQQLAVFKRRNPRPRLDALDTLFWLAAQRIRSEWKNSLIVVTPETVVGWHRAGFRFYWKLISRVRMPVGRTRPTRLHKLRQARGGRQGSITSSATRLIRALELGGRRSIQTTRQMGRSVSTFPCVVELSHPCNCSMLLLAHLIRANTFALPAEISKLRTAVLPRPS
jgi:hypothetical protein